MTLEEIIEEFDEEYGHEHRKICEGSKCVCRKVFQGFIEKAHNAGIQAALDALPKELGSATAVAQFDSGRGVTEMGMSGVQGFNVAISEAKEAITKLIK